MNFKVKQALLALACLHRFGHVADDDCRAEKLQVGADHGRDPRAVKALFAVCIEAVIDLLRAQVADIATATASSSFCESTSGSTSR